uniref:Uncharacterized protein n=1 Tax=Sphaerodactylus townsendi TaxID=933632 RepID=A0ACB8F0Q3_9SAUR
MEERLARPGRPVAGGGRHVQASWAPPPAPPAARLLRRRPHLPASHSHQPARGRTGGQAADASRSLRTKACRPPRKRELASSPPPPREISSSEEKVGAPGEEGALPRLQDRPPPLDLATLLRSLTPQRRANRRVGWA